MSSEMHPSDRWLFTVGLMVRTTAPILFRSQGVASSMGRCCISRFQHDATQTRQGCLRKSKGETSHLSEVASTLNLRTAGTSRVLCAYFNKNKDSLLSRSPCDCLVRLENETTFPLRGRLFNTLKQRQERTFKHTEEDYAKGQRLSCHRREVPERTSA